MLKSGLLSITLRQCSPDEVIRAAVAGGLDSIEWGGDVHVPPGDEALARQVGDATRAAGLDVSSYGSYYRVASAADAAEDFEPVLATTLALGVPLVRVWAGRKDSAEFSEAEREGLIAESRRLGEAAARHGLVVAFEYHRNTYTDQPAAALDLVRRVNLDNVRVHWQPRVGVPAEDSAMELNALLPHLANVHVFHWVAGFEDRRVLREGRALWEVYLRIVAGSERVHHCSLEYVRGDDPEQVVEDAVTLRDIVASVGRDGSEPAGAGAPSGAIRPDYLSDVRRRSMMAKARAARSLRLSAASASASAFWIRGEACGSSFARRRASRN